MKIMQLCILILIKVHSILRKHKDNILNLKNQYTEKDCKAKWQKNPLPSFPSHLFFLLYSPLLLFLSPLMLDSSSFLPFLLLLLSFFTCSSTSSCLPYTSLPPFSPCPPLWSSSSPTLMLYSSSSYFPFLILLSHSPSTSNSSSCVVPSWPWSIWIHPLLLWAALSVRNCRTPPNGDTTGPLLFNRGKYTHAHYAVFNNGNTSSYI